MVCLLESPSVFPDEVGLPSTTGEVSGGSPKTVADPLLLTRVPATSKLSGVTANSLLVSVEGAVMVETSLLASVVGCAMVALWTLIQSSEKTARAAASIGRVFSLALAAT